MRDHDEVFRRVMQAKEQYEQQKKEKSMFRITKSSSRRGKAAKNEGRNKSSKALVWAMRVVAALVCIAMIGGIVAAVHFGSKNQSGKGKGGSTPASEGVTPEPTATVTGLAALPSGTVFTMWTSVNENHENYAAFQQAIAQMQSRYPNITLQVVYDPEDNLAYRDKIASAMSSGETPDIIDSWGYDFLRGFIDDGKVYCLDGAYQPYEGLISNAVIESVSKNGRKYGVPVSTTAIVMYVNMDALRSAGYNEVPTTYADLVACCDALLAQGITPFGCTADMGASWCVEEYLRTFLVKAGGLAAAADAYPGGTAVWSNNKIAGAVDLFEEFIGRGYFSMNSVNLPYDNLTVKNGLKNGEYAFFVSGDWDCIELQNSNADIRVYEFPVLDSENAGAGQFVGGTVDALFVPNASSKKDTAALYAVELGQLLSEYGYLAGVSLPAWEIDYNDNEVGSLFRSVAALTQQANAFSPYCLGVSDFSCPYDMEQVVTYTRLVQDAYRRAIDGATFVGTMAAFHEE